jgi:hypothetical protein
LPGNRGFDSFPDRAEYYLTEEAEENMRTEQEPAATISQIESTIRRLRSVISARVRGNERGEIEEIHVVSDDSRHPKQVGRDIESLLLSELGMHVDHRKISIAQLRESSALEPEGRLKFLNIDLSIDRSDTAIKVNLGTGSDVFSGASHSGRNESQLEAVAGATAAAIREFLTCTGELTVPKLEVRQVIRNVLPGSGEIITVAVALISPRGEEVLVGSSLVREAGWQAAAYATLDALNRKLPHLFG